MIEAAGRHAPANVTCILADVLKLPLPEQHYDAIVSMTALHHVDLGEALRHLAPALRPGGVLAAVVLPRSDLRHELPLEVAAAVSNRIFGAGFAVLRRLGRADWYRFERTNEAMPKVMDPPLTTRQARAVATEILPGAQVRRLLFWRYLVLWGKPG